MPRSTLSLRPGTRSLAVLRLLDASPAGLTIRQCITRNGEGPSTSFHSQYGAILLNAEAGGWAERAGAARDGPQGHAVIIWRITPAGQTGCRATGVASGDRERARNTTAAFRRLEPQPQQPPDGFTGPLVDIER